MPSQLIQETTEKLAVAEALYCYAAGIDLRDPALLGSVLTESAVSDFRPAAAKAGFFEYPVLEGRGHNRPSPDGFTQSVQHHALGE